MSNKIKVETTSFHDRPIRSNSEDMFDIESHFVDKVFSLISKNDISPLTIAVTGEWGSGKSSAINLLCNKISSSKKNILIFFEPLLEGKLELINIIQLFYIKLHSNLKNNKEAKKKIKSILNAILTLSKCNVSANLGIPYIGQLGIEANPTENLKSFLNSFEDNELIKTFSEQTKEVNERLKESKLYVVIDEIDRLNAEHILNFLMFARILETFDNLICIVGIDYEKVIKKLINEKVLGLCEYRLARDYLDKLFQIAHPIHINNDKKIKFAFEKLREIDTDNTLNEIFEPQIYDSEYYKVQNNLSNLISYISTPRQIKKWLMQLKINYNLLKYIPNKADFLMFVAVIVKHPILLENLSKHTIYLLSRKHYFPALWLNERYGLDFSLKDFEKISDDLMIASFGIKNNAIEKNLLLKEFLKIITDHPIEDKNAEKFARNFLISAPVYLIRLFIEGHKDVKEMSAYQDFFENDIDFALNLLMKDNNLSDIFAHDLSHALSEIPIQISNKPSIALLNELWQKKVGEEFFIMGNPYYRIILFSISNCSIEDIISRAHFSLSESFINNILVKFNIKNENGQYNIKKFTKFNNAINSTYNVKFKNITLDSFNKNTITEILKSWLAQVEISFRKNEVFSQCRLLGIFYRYIQWGKLLQLDNCEKLSKFIKSYLTDQSVKNKEKKRVIEIITEECAKYLNPINQYSSSKDPLKNPLKILFDSNKDLLKEIQNFIKSNNIKYETEFNNVVSQI